MGGKDAVKSGSCSGDVLAIVVMGIVLGNSAGGIYELLRR